MDTSYGRLCYISTDDLYMQLAYIIFDVYDFTRWVTRTRSELQALEFFQACQDFRYLKEDWWDWVGLETAFFNVPVSWVMTLKSYWNMYVNVAWKRKWGTQFEG